MDYQRFTFAVLNLQNLLIEKSQVLDDTQCLKHKRIGLLDRTAAAAMPAEYKSSPLIAIIGFMLTTEYVRDILAVLTRFAVKRTHENDRSRE